MNRVISIKHLLIILISIVFISSCSEDLISDRRTDDERERVRQQTELEQIKNYAKEGKVVTSIKQVNSDRQEDRDGVGWLVSFDDGTQLTVTNGLTMDVLQIPYLRISGTGEWTIAYNGNDFMPFTDSDGTALTAFKDVLSKESYNKIRYDGSDGTEINLSLCDSSNDEIINKMSLPIDQSSHTIIKFILRDDISRELMLLLSDGTTVKFAMVENDIEEIILVSEEPVVISAENSSATFLLKVTPENAIINYSQLKLNFVRGVWALNNGTYPFKVTSIETAKNEAGDLLEGQYAVTVEDMGDNIIAYDEEIFMSVAQSGDGDILTSDNINVRYESEYPFLKHTGLPVVVINIPNHKEITSKDVWTEGVEMKIYDEKGKLDYEGSLQMKGRGNSTWAFPKKPYALKLDSKSKILGMKKHKRWCLLANYIDRTLIRNAVAFEISRNTGLEYTPSGRFVELVVNGTHRGNYYLTEQIKVDENRVNVAELDAGASSGDAITGGYIFELDNQYDETYKFYSKNFKYPWMFKDPDEVNQYQYNYIVNYVAEMESAIWRIPGSDDYANYLDRESFAYYWIALELTNNTEPQTPKSVYFNKDINGKIKAGPVWDFDWDTFTPYKSQRSTMGGGVYYYHLQKDPKFKAILKEKWEEYKQNHDKVLTFIEEQRKLIEKSNELNFSMWGCPRDMNGDNNMTYNEAIDRLKRAYETKYQWLDSYIKSL